MLGFLWAELTQNYSECIDLGRYFITCKFGSSFIYYRIDFLDKKNQHALGKSQGVCDFAEYQGIPVPQCSC